MLQVGSIVVERFTTVRYRLARILLERQFSVWFDTEGASGALPHRLSQRGALWALALPVAPNSGVRQA